MIIEKINSAQYGPQNEVIFDIDARETSGSTTEKITYEYRSDDPYAGAIGVYLKDWLAGCRHMFLLPNLRSTKLVPPCPL